MNELEIFKYEGNGVRSFKDDKGLSWFVAKDICTVLEISNSRDALRKLDEDEKGVGNYDTLGGIQELSIINEYGVFSLVFRSRKPEAKEFKRWLTHIVIPSLKNNGGYLVNQEHKTKEELYAATALYYANVVKSIEEDLLQSKKETTELKIEKLRNRPKVNAFNDLLNAVGMQNLSTVGKILTGHPNLFTQQLVNDSILFRRNKILLPYSRYDKKYFVVREYYHEPTNTLSHQTFVTPEGVAWLAKKYGESA